MKETTIKHLELIHNVINRLSHKSFLVKSWSITAITALIAFGIDKEDYRIFLIGFPITIIFWYLDSQYLWLEKVFRKLYDGVRNKEVKSMSMDISDYKIKVNKWVIFKRPTILPIYLFEIILLIFCVLYFKCIQI
ncbi:hypothetical protein [Confluentibacter flavum]|uniref:Uncharacterized protein n=1 Tax=Confluentibacter flavum TaxID=1909700 RepID=A0A2N3HMF5_9FLAO|nr:hypothetical protein [Confluentibacter flavum]PKQ46074.1 hypothetical protein CSW08_04855 [Confluentibacter flavum]